jgi:hypothetical protein
MNSDDSVEVYGYCRSREETERVVSELDKAGISSSLWLWLWRFYGEGLRRSRTWVSLS